MLFFYTVNYSNFLPLEMDWHHVFGETNLILCIMVDLVIFKSPYFHFVLLHVYTITTVLVILFSTFLCPSKRIK